MMTLATMSNPGNMSDADLGLFILMMVVLAGLPFILGVLMMTLNLIKTILKWILVGAFVFLGWKLGGKVLGMLKGTAIGDKVDKASKIMEAFNKE